MMVAFWVFSLLGAFSIFSTAAAYSSCKEIAETVSNPVNQEYQLLVNGQLLNVFCEFRPNNIGYTYLRPVGAIDFNQIANLLNFLSIDKSEYLLKFTTQGSQFESVIRPLSFYSTFLFNPKVSAFFPYSSPTTTPPYFYLGIVPKNLIWGPGFANGYQVNGVDFWQNTCNSQGNSYFLLDPKYGQTANTMAPNNRPWYLNRIAAGTHLPWYFFFHWTESQNCFTYEEGWGLNIGLKFTYNPPCAVPIAPYEGNICQTRNGQCKKTSCPENICPTSFRYGMCGNYETDYKCCLSTPFSPATCSFYGDPHISTYDGNFYDNHVAGWYYASRDCNWFWHVRAFFDNAVSPYWTIFNTMQFVVAGNILQVDKFGNANFNGGNLFGPMNIISIPGIIIVLSRPATSSVITVVTTFGVTIEITTSPYPVLTIKLQSTWLYKTCGLCGPWDLDYANDLAYQFNSRAQRNKREVEEADEDSPIRQKRQTECAADLLANANIYCEGQLAADSGNCGTVSVADYKENCLFDYCLGGEAAANYSLHSFREDCYPPKRATCSMCGFREFETFDSVGYHHLGAECEYEFASDCTDTKDWFVYIVLKDQKLGGADALQLSRVKIFYLGYTIVFIRSGKVVKVDDEDITTDYTSPTSDFIVTFFGHLVEFRAPTLVVSYNFKQMLKVQIAEEYYNKTCGLCGSWDDDTSNDVTDGDTFARYTCDPGAASTPCSTPAEQEAAEDLCRASLQAVVCEELDIDKMVPRCAYEFCDGGYKMLCLHILEALDKCFWLTGDVELLDITPSACQTCPPPGNRRPSSGVNPGSPNECDLLPGVCLDERCETCKTGFVDNLCLGSTKKCCPFP